MRWNDVPLLLEKDQSSTEDTRFRNISRVVSMKDVMFFNIFFFVRSFADDDDFLPRNAPGPQFASDSIVYNHYSNPSDIILSSKPVNKYLKEHHSKYYDKEPSYHYTIGRDDYDKSDYNYNDNNYYENHNPNDVNPPFKSSAAGSKTKTYDFVIGEDSTHMKTKPELKKLYSPTKRKVPLQVKELESKISTPNNFETNFRTKEIEPPSVPIRPPKPDLYEKSYRPTPEPDDYPRLSYFDPTRKPFFDTTTRSPPSEYFETTTAPATRPDYDYTSQRWHFG